MPATHNLLTVAAAQHSSVFLNLRESVEKACRLIAEASENGAKLIVFPEAFIPGYPDWVWVVKNSDGASLNRYYRERWKRNGSASSRICLTLSHAALTQVTQFPSSSSS